MDTPLYKLYLFRRNAKFYETPAPVYRAIRDQMDARQRELGIRDLFNAEMAWSNEKFEYFGVEFYPNEQALRAYTLCLMETGFYQFIDSESYLGIPMDTSYPDFSLEPPPPGQEPVFRLYMSRKKDYAYQMPPNELEEAYANVDEVARQLGVKPLLGAFARWNSEEWEYFGIERFPSLEAAISYSQFLSHTGWYRIMESRSFLGIAYGGLVSGVKE